MVFLLSFGVLFYVHGGCITIGVQWSTTDMASSIWMGLYWKGMLVTFADGTYPIIRTLRKILVPHIELNA
jgi:hypothetical protein